jgi:hypothetical protein
MAWYSGRSRKERDSRKGKKEKIESKKIKKRII